MRLARLSGLIRRCSHVVGHVTCIGLHRTLAGVRSALERKQEIIRKRFEPNCGERILQL